MAHVREWYLPVKLSIPVIMHDCPCYFPCKLLWPCNLLMMVIPSPCSKWKTVLDVVTICSSPFSFASHLLDQWGLLQYTYRTGRFASIDIPRPLRENCNISDLAGRTWWNNTAPRANWYMKVMPPSLIHLLWFQWFGGVQIWPQWPRSTFWTVPDVAACGMLAVYSTLHFVQALLPCVQLWYFLAL